MHINKNDILNVISKVQGRQPDKNVDSQGSLAQGAGEQNGGRESGVIKLDMLRNQVMNLQKEVNQIQTEISGHQIQIAFLENLETSEGWQKELQSFLSGRAPSSSPRDNEAKQLPEGAGKQQYIAGLKSELTALNSDLVTHEVKLENIFSSGIIDAEYSEISSAIMKDAEEVRQVFSKIRHQSIHKLIQM